jgi:Tfp pilus assembly protein PilP
MKLTIGILAMGLAVGTAWGQNTDAIENTRDTMKALQQKQVMDQNAALGSSQAQPSNPAPSAPKSASSSQSASKPKVTSAPKAANPKGEQASITIVRTPKVAPAVKVATASKGAAKTSASKSAPPKTQVKAASKAPRAEQVVAVEDKKGAEPKKPEQKKINLTGRRDPFVSPIVSRSMLGSGCSTGKRCLAIDQIALKGVVRSDTGMIAVVTNALDKAYFLHENDPVFNGYVVKITGDSIVFKETVQDKLGKPFMREVTKTITTPAV